MSIRAEIPIRELDGVRSALARRIVDVLMDLKCHEIETFEQFKERATRLIQKEIDAHFDKS